jgi:hypothetical protein
MDEHTEIVDIPPGEWPRFLQTFTGQHRAWLATVQVEGDGSESASHRAAQPLVRPLEWVRAEMRSDRVSAIELSLGTAESRQILKVDDPIGVRVWRTQEGADSALEIEGGRGRWTRIQFRASVPADRLDGVVPEDL